uniref:Uncharacterized protein n=1 Tax=Micrurus lemniscatus lemniscatus TaxID=129467 RepID=A0A2D4HYN8_MICLE
MLGEQRAPSPLDHAFLVPGMTTFRSSCKSEIYLLPRCDQEGERRHLAVGNFFQVPPRVTVDFKVGSGELLQTLGNPKTCVSLVEEGSRRPLTRTPENRANRLKESFSRSLPITKLRKWYLS